MTKRRHPTSKAQEAALWREELADWLNPDNPLVSEFFRMWRRAAQKTAGSATFPEHDTTRDIILNISRRVQMSEMFYLTSDVSRFIYEASQTMPPHPIMQEDYPSTHGWLQFQTPLQFDIVEGRGDMLMRGVMWSRESVGKTVDHPGAVFWDMSDVNYIKDRVHRGNAPRGLFDNTHVSLLSMGTVSDWQLPWMYWNVNFDATKDIGDAVTSATRLPSVEKALTEYYESEGIRGFYSPIPEGAEILKNGEADGHWRVRTVEGMIVHMEPDRVARFMQCFFLFLNQKLPALDLQYRHLPKPWMQDLKKKYKHVSTAPITIINWRKRLMPPPDPDREPGSRTLHYRHVRRGHWRRNNKRRDKVTGEWYLYPVYINPTIVGGENLPFREREVVNVVNR
jgi:hypothetical protein